MIISLARLPVDGLEFEHRYTPEELDLGARDFDLDEYPYVSGRVDRIGMDMRLRGKIEAIASRGCDRCLRELTIKLEIPFDLLYTPVDSGANRGGEIELQEKDLDFAAYENDEIDLDQMVLEQLELGLPSRLLCKEDCQGLCQQCGTDLNSEECGCEEPIDPRWGALIDAKREFNGLQADPGADEDQENQED